jgi:hypothetical protein
VGCVAITGRRSRTRWRAFAAGTPVGRRCQADAVFEVREEEVYVAGGAADEAAGIFGVAAIEW